MPSDRQLSHSRSQSVSTMGQTSRAPTPRHYPACRRSPKDLVCSSPQGFLRGLSLSGEVMGPETSCGRQGRVARQRAVAERGLHRHESSVASKESGHVIQRSLNGGAMDQRGQECRQVDSASLPDPPGKPCSSATLRLSVQRRELPPPACTSKRRAAVVADYAEGEARPDRCQGHPARQVRDAPACGSRRTSTTLRSDPQADRQT